MVPTEVVGNWGGASRGEEGLFGETRSPERHGFLGLGPYALGVAFSIEV